MQIRYEVTKRAEGHWRLVLRLSERESIDQHLRFKTKREAEAARRAFQQELEDLNRHREES